MFANIWDSKAVRQLRFIYHPELRKGTGIWVFKEVVVGAGRSNSQKGKESKYLANKCLLYHAAMSCRWNTWSLIIALFLVHAPFLKGFMQVKERWKDFLKCWVLIAFNLKQPIAKMPPGKPPEVIFIIKTKGTFAMNEVLVSEFLRDLGDSSGWERTLSFKIKQGFEP